MCACKMSKLPINPTTSCAFRFDGVQHIELQSLLKNLKVNENLLKHQISFATVLQNT